MKHLIRILHRDGVLANNRKLSLDHKRDKRYSSDKRCKKNERQVLVEQSSDTCAPHRCTHEKLVFLSLQVLLLVKEVFVVNTRSPVSGSVKASMSSVSRKKQVKPIRQCARQSSSQGKKGGALREYSSPKNAYKLLRHE